MKKLVAAAAALFIILFACALAEENIYIPTDEGGVISRETAQYRTRALIEELNVAYLDSDSPYLTKGVQTKFTLFASGGDGRYSYFFSIYRRSGTSGGFSFAASSGVTASNVWYFTPETDSGQYLLVVRVTDSAGSSIEWQSQVFESSTQASVMKARSLAEECKRNASSDYARALWLHDWLIYNANYDYTFQYYYPDGVLLHGTGVCQSYALAYEMLLKLVGIECLYVTGEAGGGAHGWNLVKIDGKWFHVDCTWDDPGTGGSERHTYFCVPDEVMMRDHMWRHEAQILPECTDRDYMYAVRAGADTCITQSDVIDILNNTIINRRGYAEIWYTGDETEFDFEAAFDAWFNQDPLPASFSHCRYWAEDTNLRVEFDYGDGYPDLSVPVSMVIDSTKTNFEKGDEVRFLVLTIPSTADTSELVWTSSNSNVIRVDNGFAEAVSPGVCVITACHLEGARAEITVYVSSGSYLEIPSFVSKIEAEAFSGCLYLEKVNILDGVTEIGDEAFLNCSLLKTVAIPPTVTHIGFDAFSGCGRVVIECESGSYAHQYAEAEGIAYQLMSTEP